VTRPAAITPATEQAARRSEPPVIRAARPTQGLHFETEFVDGKLKAKAAPASAAPKPKATPAVQTTAPTPVAQTTRSLGQRLQAPEAQTRPSASQTTVVLKGASTVTHAEQQDLGPVDLLARAGLSPNGHTLKTPASPVLTRRAARPPLDIEREIEALVPQGNDENAANTATHKATLLIGMRDKRATDVTLDAARRLLTLGKLQSASDLLLDYIAHGFTDREPQRLLIEIDCAIGRRDTAKEKCQLLSHAYRLDGRTDVAEDVERIARII
jgi:hypothetical protein